MPGIRSTKNKSNGPQLLAGFGIPVLTQAVWTAKRDPEDSGSEDDSSGRKIRTKKSDGAGKDSEERLSVRVLWTVGRLPTKRAMFTVVWGVILVLILPFAFTAFGGKGAASSSAHGARASGRGELEPAAGRHAAPVGTAKEIGVSVVEKKHQDQALQVLEALSCDEFTSPEELATGRFLQEIGEKIPLVRGMDLDTLSVVARGPGWARLEARYRPSKPWFEKQEEEQILILDLVEEEAQWKLEDVRVQAKRK